MSTHPAAYDLYELATQLAGAAHRQVTHGNCTPATTTNRARKGSPENNSHQALYVSRQPLNDFSSLTLGVYLLIAALVVNSLAWDVL